MIVNPKDGKAWFSKNLGKSKPMVICDENTKRDCLPLFQREYLTISSKNIIEIPAGEAHKNLETCQLIWDKMLALGADRSTPLVALGGGVVCDITGFVASTFKRGMPCILVPTTLLAQSDAAIGGKNGVNHGQLKNQIGTIRDPHLVVIDTRFLDTLSQRELKSGFAETLKHALIADHAFWQDLVSERYTLQNCEAWIDHSIAIKQSIAAQDPNEDGQRKLLNFGHTLGHALESAAADQSIGLLHGEAIAFGMVAESMLSRKLCGLPSVQLEEIVDFMKNTYTLDPRIAAISFDDCQKKLPHDKKANNGSLNFTLIRSIGDGVINQNPKSELLADVFAETMTLMTAG